MNDVKFAYGYVRVSTEKQEELSPDSQRKLLSEYAHKNGIVLLEVFNEIGISGRSADKRPAFQRMISLAKSPEHPVDVILVWKFSRFARNQEESIVYKSLLKQKHSVDVISVSEPLTDGPFGSLIERIIEWMDEYYSIRLSGEVFRGMAENARRGSFQARPPLGYRIPYTHALPEIVPEEAEIVQSIFRMYTQDHMSIFDITRRLNGLGLRTAHGKPFEKRSVAYILENPVYVGKTRWNRSENATKQIKDKDEWIIASGRHEAIIDEATFQAAQDRKEREYHPRNTRPSSTCAHWLSGILKCSACGRTLSVNSHIKKDSGIRYVNFQCYGYLKGKCTVSHNISEKKLVPVVMKSLHEALLDDHMEFESKSVKDQEHRSTLLLLEMQRDKIDQKEARIKAAYMDGIDSLEEYKKNKDFLYREKEKLENQIAELSQESASKEVTTKEMHSRIRSAYDIIESNDFSMQEKNEAVKSILEKIIFYKTENRLQFYYYYK